MKSDAASDITESPTNYSDGEDSMNKDSVKDTIFEIAVDMFSLNENDKKNFEDMYLEYDLKCDTLDIVEFIMNVEEEFNVFISDDESNDILTFGDCIDLVWSKILSDKKE